MRLRYRRLLAPFVGLVILCGGIPAAQAYKQWRTRSERARMAELLWSGPGHPDGEFSYRPELELEPDGAEIDDPRLRQVLGAQLWGNRTGVEQGELVRIAHEEALRWPQLMPGRKTRAAVAGLSWVNLGPDKSLFEWNGGNDTKVNAGRVSGILMHPTNPDRVYVATAGGGVWRTDNFSTNPPTWKPISETFGNLAIGAVEMDPNAPDTLYAGIGDFVDFPGGQMMKTTDGGITWSGPLNLTGTYPPAAGALAVTAKTIRMIKVDPADSNVVLVGTDVGLFRSTDAGASYSLVDLPNAGGTQLPENVWTIVHTGAVAGVSRWAISGVYACDTNQAPPPAGWGTVAGSAVSGCGFNPVNNDICVSTCTHGNPGDIWVSTDAGASWSSRKAAGSIPATAVGRIALGGGTPSVASPPVTVIYAQLGALDEYNTAGAAMAAGYWRSNDSGSSWTAINGTLGNTSAGCFAPCTSANVAADQAWYNQAVAVDPADDNHVMVGGFTCHARTINGLNASPTWQLTSSGYVPAGCGGVAGGNLDQMHSDGHRALVVRNAAFANGYRVFMGTDGGLYYSDNAFSAASPTNASVTWSYANKGLVTHLSYSVASGNPANGNPYVAFTGLQDNGIRFRDSTVTNSTSFNEIVGGDGFGATLNKLGAGGAALYVGSNNSNFEICDPGSTSCNVGGNWAVNTMNPNTCAGDAVAWYKWVVADQGSAALQFITHSYYGVYKLSKPAATWKWNLISPCFSFVRGVVASQTIAGLYGEANGGGVFNVANGCTGTAVCTWTASQPLWVDLNGNAVATNDEKVSYAMSLSFPPVTPGGKTDGDVYVASSVAPRTVAGAAVPAALGHVFKTTDRGATWTALHGNGTGFDLPNVAVAVVRYDPGDATGNTIYAATDLGIYRTTDGGNTWARFGAGMPLVKVTDMYVGKTGGLIRASTYGRGLWEIYPSAGVAAGVKGNGDFDRDLQLDFVDLAAMASRTGTDPTTAAQPYYDWNMDTVGATNAIDDTGDLVQLLSRLGGRP